MLGNEKVQPVNVDSLQLSHPELVQLIQRAQDADIADHQLTVRQALHKYKKAVTWAMMLSVALVMEGEYWHLLAVYLITQMQADTTQRLRFGYHQLILWSDTIPRAIWNPAA